MPNLNFCLCGSKKFSQVVPQLRQSKNQDGLFLSDLNPYELQIKITDLETQKTAMLWTFIKVVGDEALVGFDLNDWEKNLHGEQVIQNPTKTKFSHLKITPTPYRPINRAFLCRYI